MTIARGETEDDKAARSDRPSRRFSIGIAPAPRLGEREREKKIENAQPHETRRA